MTNYERIKDMTVEEMAKMIANEIPHGDCYNCDRCEPIEKPLRLDSYCEDAWLSWLESEAEE